MATFRDKNHRPVAIPPQVENIPDDMRQLKHWILWKTEWDSERNAWSKTPYQTNGRHAKSDTPSTWSTFQQVVMAWANAQSAYSGIGFVFSSEAGIYGIDLDNCVTEEEYELRLSPYAASVVAQLDTYCEISPSRTGLHLICRAKDIESLKTSEIEVYGTGRYFTVTGVVWDEIKHVAEMTEPLRKIVATVKQQREEKHAKPEATSRATVILPLTIRERLDKAFAASNGGEVRRLYDGHHGDDHSAADLSLCNLLAFYSDGDAGILDQMFRSSALYRDKWDVRHYADGRTYGEETVAKALANCTEFYGQKPLAQPAKKNEPAPTVEQQIARRSAYAFDIGDLAPIMKQYRIDRASQQKISTGWRGMDHLYSPTRNAMSVITGYPNSGKSTWLDNLLVNLFNAHRWKFAIVSFETQPVALHALQIASILMGRPWSLNRNNHLTEEEIDDASSLMKGHFIFHTIPESDRSMERVLEYIGDAIAAHKIDGFVFDPWAELNPPEKLIGHMTHFVQGNLAKLRAFTVSNPIHTWLVAHPAKLNRQVRKDDLDAPDLYDVADSAHFANKADYGLTVHRHNKGQADDHTEVIVTKVRRGLPGRLGSIKLDYQDINGSYLEREASESSQQHKKHYVTEY